MILEWNRLVIAGTFERRPNERVVTTIARVVPNVGATVKIRMPGYEGRMNGGQDLWTVIEIRAAADGASRLLRLRRVPVL